MDDIINPDRKVGFFELFRLLMFALLVNKYDTN
jgi:hypothetical protein